MHIEHYTKRSILRVPNRELWEWHIRPGAFERLAPPWQEISVTDPGDGVAEGSRAVLRLRKNGLPVTWLAEHRNLQPPDGFDDVQVRGPFRLWEHRHRFHEHAEGAALEDDIRYALPLGTIGRILGARSVRNDIERTFRYRHQVTAADLNLHSHFRDRGRLRVAVSGASGLIGSALCALLTTGGHEVVRLVRGKPTSQTEAHWDPSSGALDLERLEGLDAIVHLAGENISGKRWTARQMARIRDSRVDGTRNLMTSLKKLARPPRSVIGASAIGIYGNRNAELLNEDSGPGTGFFASLGQAWEGASCAGDFPARRVLARFGIVLSPKGGALAKMYPIFRMGLGGAIGSGSQFMSWISLDDAISALLTALFDDSLSGPINVTAPTPVTNLEFTRTLGRVLKRPTAFPLPGFAVRAAFGRMADEALLSSARVLPSKLANSGYQFRHRDLESALRHLLGRQLKNGDRRAGQ